MHPFDWKLLQSAYIIQDRWLSLRADTCQLPNGGTVVPYYVLEYPPWVNVVALTKDEHVVLVRQYRHGVQQTVVELPSGTVEQTDASPLAAMKRELLEETGYASEVWYELGKLSPNSANHTNLTYCFLATGVTGCGATCRRYGTRRDRAHAAGGSRQSREHWGAVAGVAYRSAFFCAACPGQTPCDVKTAV
jgi:ADP-ribose pyrophosphatase